MSGAASNSSTIPPTNSVSSITVTPTGTVGTITVEGVTIASGDTSSSIALTPGVEKTITVSTVEEGKGQKTYNIKITRGRDTQATPTLNPVGGAVAFGSTVNITSAGAEHIYYTTDGTTPGTSIGGATLEYSAPITINAAKTIKAIAIKTGNLNSEIASESYTQAASADLTNIVLSDSPAGFIFVGGTYNYESEVL